MLSRGSFYFFLKHFHVKWWIQGRWWHTLIVSRLLMWKRCGGRSSYACFVACLLSMKGEMFPLGNFSLFLKLFLIALDVRSVQLVLFPWFLYCVPEILFIIWVKKFFCALPIIWRRFRNRRLSWLRRCRSSLMLQHCRSELWHSQR